MGWSANTSIEVVFRDMEALQLAATVIRHDPWAKAVLEWDGRDKADDYEVIILALRAFGEEGDINVEEDKLTFIGSNWGNAYSHGDDPISTPYRREVPCADGSVTVHEGVGNRGGLGLYRILSTYATGTIDWDTFDGYYWRVRLNGDGTWQRSDGWVTYPEDEKKDAVDSDIRGRTFFDLGDGRQLLVNVTDDLSDADIAEMQAMGMVAKDEPHDSSDTGTAVPIQRYGWTTFGPLPAADGGWALYADHVQAVDEARTAALREALALVREREADLLSCHKDDECRTYAYIVGVIADDIQYRLIDGGGTR